MMVWFYIFGQELAEKTTCKERRNEEFFFENRTGVKGLKMLAQVGAHQRCSWRIPGVSKTWIPYWGERDKKHG